MKDKTWLGIGALILAVSAVLAVPQSAGAQVSSTGKFEYWGDIACPTSLRECDLVGATLPRSGATTGASTSTPSVLIERGHFNKPLTIVPTTTIGSLSAISCWNNGCKAVGNAQGKPLILVLRGGRWEEDTGVTTPGFLNAVTCRNATDCNAVGSIPGDGTLEARWDGHTWTIGPRTDPAGATNVVLLGVSCAAADDCTAVGNAGSRPVVARFDGKAWATTYLNLTLTGTTGATLRGVQCFRTGCIAAGTTFVAGGTNQLVVRLQGDTPSLVDVPTLPKSQIAALDCTSLKDCLMVGGTNGETLAERYDGRRVTVVPTANPPGTTFNALNAIACRYGRIPTKLLRRCAAIGTGGTASPPYLETWDSKTRIFRLGAQLSLR